MASDRSSLSVGVYSVMGLVPSPPGRVEHGEVLYKGRDLLRISPEELRGVRGKDIAMVFQDPMTSLNPVLTVGLQITEVLREHLSVSKHEANKRTVELLAMVGIPNAEDWLKDYPHQFSGGQRQRICIARALATEPDILICDEPTSALDVSVQAQILNLLKELQYELSMSYLFITHNMAVVSYMADEVLVMRNGQAIEAGKIEEILNAPKTAYTQKLLSSVLTI